MEKGLENKTALLEMMPWVSGGTHRIVVLVYAVSIGHASILEWKSVLLLATVGPTRFQTEGFLQSKL